MKFAAPYFLILLPLLWVFMVWAWRRNDRRRARLMAKLGGTGAESGASRPHQRADRFLFAVLMSALLATLARPIYFAPDNRDELQGAPYLVALDASRSMLANDVDPNRYSAAAGALDRFIAQARSEQIGLITFAGVAQLNAPLTFDTMALRTILAYVNPLALQDPGSSLGAAIDRAGRFFRSNNIPQRTLVIISDGEDLEGNAVALARRLNREEGLTIHAIGVGTPLGAPIKAQRSAAGAEVISKMDESSLRRIANAAGGQFYRLGHNGEGLARLREEILRPLAEKLARNDLRNYHEAYYAPLAVAVLALLARLGLSAERVVRRKPLPSILNAMRSFLCCLLFAVNAEAGIDLNDLQDRIAQGNAVDAWRQLNHAVNKDPRNPHLLYNRAVASYAAGRFDEALVDLDMVEDSQRKDLVPKAQFQKGNAHYKLGLANLQRDVELTLSRWRQSISEYKSALKTDAAYPGAKSNHDLVHKRMLELLMRLGATNLNTAERSTAIEQRINTARAAMEEFHEASELQPQDLAAKQGEDRARELLAQALVNEGERRTMSTNLVAGARNEPPLLRPDTARIEEGVNMLQDAQSLKPNDQGIREKLERGQDRLADALTTQAETYQSLEPRIPRIDEKLGLLRMAMELLEKALAERPNHQRAKNALENLKRRLAEIHEQEGDRLEAASEEAQLDQAAQQLSNALDHFQQATQLQPSQPQLPQKAQRAQSRLEKALEQLGDQLMKAPNRQESLDEQVMRMEGAAQAFNELESLRPSPQTSQKARTASEQLEKLRQMLAERGQPQPRPGFQQPGMSQFQPQPDNDGVPMDSAPRLDKKGRNGRYQSGAMNRSLRDY